jgi:hypothetical protein
MSFRVTGFHLLITLLLGLLFAVPGTEATAEIFEVPRYDYIFDLPVTWEGMDVDGAEALSFRRKGEDTVFQALTMDGESFPDAEGLYQYISSTLALEGDPASYAYNGYEGTFAEVTFSAAGERVYGYCICLNDCPEDLTLIAYAPENRYDRIRNELISCLDGFSAGPEATLLPGPVSQYQYPWPGPHTESIPVEILGQTKRAVIDPTEKEVSQILIEREAAILASLEELDIGAWHRYYTMVYRDTHPRFAPLFRPTREVLSDRGDGLPSDREIAEILLAWIQSFSYERTGTVSDLLSPLTAVLENRGDCDARCLAYMILLEYLGIESILLVSSTYGHSLVGVDVPGSGARFEHEGTEYRIAETTDQVDMGLIDRSMADPAGWIPMKLHP